MQLAFGCALCCLVPALHMLMQRKKGRLFRRRVCIAIAMWEVFMAFMNGLLGGCRGGCGGMDPAWCYLVSGGAAWCVTDPAHNVSKRSYALHHELCFR